MESRLFVFCVCLLVATLFGGCGKDTQMRKVSGIVTYNGSPLDEAIINFIPVGEEGLLASGRTDTTGRYELTTLESKVPGSGTLPGKYNVTVSKIEKNPGPPVSSDIETEMKDKYSSRLSLPPSVHLIPKKYMRPNTSGLSFTVEDVKLNEFNIELVD